MSRPSQGPSTPGDPGAQSYSSRSNQPRRASYALVAAGLPEVYQQDSNDLYIPTSTDSSVRRSGWQGQDFRRAAETIRQNAMSREQEPQIPSWGSGSRDVAELGDTSYAGLASNSWVTPMGRWGADPFFKPTYLRGSKYIEDLEASYRDEVEEEEEQKPTRTVKTSSSRNASSTGLRDMQASHRGMAYEIIEHEPTPIEIGPARLPSRWAQTDKFNCMELSGHGLDVKFSGPVKLHDLEGAACRTDRPMPTEAGIYYYEVTIMSKGKDGMIGVGFSSQKASLERLPGWEAESWAYHGDDGRSFCCQHVGKQYGPTFTTDDTIGCGVNFTNGTAFFTKNGNYLGDAFREIKDTAIYPSVGMKRPHAHLIANFGQKPFVYDIDAHVQRRKNELLEQIQATDITPMHPSFDRDELCQALVAQFLSHDGYVETAQAFSEEVRRDNAALTGDPASAVDGFLSIENDQDAARRQQIRAAVLEGDIDSTISLTSTYFPSVLPSNPEINFRVRCRKYIEMMRESAELLDKAPPILPFPGATSARLVKSSPPSKSNAAIAADGMEVDETSPRTATISYDDMIARTIAYGRELHTEFNEEHDPKLRDMFKETMKDLFGMLAYKDPRESPAARWLEPRERSGVAEALNGAILVSLGKSSSTSLERMYRQTYVLNDLISEDGGPGCLINVKQILKQRRRSHLSGMDWR